MSYVTVGAISGNLLGGPVVKKGSRPGLVAKPVLAPLAKRILTAFSPAKPTAVRASAVVPKSVLSVSSLAPSPVISSLSTAVTPTVSASSSFMAENWCDYRRLPGCKVKPASPAESAARQEQRDELMAEEFDEPSEEGVTSSPGRKIPWIPLAIAGAAAWFLLK